MGAASVSRAAAHSWLASEQHRAHDRSTAGRGAAQRQRQWQWQGSGRWQAGPRARSLEMWRGEGERSGFGERLDAQKQFGALRSTHSSAVEAGSKRQRLPEGWKLFAPHNPPLTAQRSTARSTETRSLDARRLAAAAGRPGSSRALSPGLEAASTSRYIERPNTLHACAQESKLSDVQVRGLPATLRSGSRPGELLGEPWSPEPPASGAETTQNAAFADRRFATPGPATPAARRA